MEIILFVGTALYCIYLNIRLRDIEDCVDDCNLERAELEINVYNKMMEIRRDLKDEKSRRKPAKKRGRVSEAKVSKSKILRKFRGYKNDLQAGGKG
jgi:hypothetical protein